MLKGVYSATKKDGTIYYRSSITFQNKHISLGSFDCEADAHAAYSEAENILTHKDISLEHKIFHPKTLKFEKVVTLTNFRDNCIYIKTPIYLHANYFSYYLSAKEEYKFDIDDLFFYSSHKIIKRGGHLFVNEYGMQTTILSRYGIRSFAVEGRDYTFANGDTTDYRYSNIIVINRYYGVTSANRHGKPCYEVRIHINGNYIVGVYDSETTAAIAYNKAVDAAIANGIAKNFAENYIPDLSAKDYATIYSNLKLSKKFLQYIKTYNKKQVSQDE